MTRNKRPGPRQFAGRIILAGRRRALSVLMFIPLFLMPFALARAEIEKIAETCDTGICFYWWPKLANVKGWHHDRAASLQNGINAQVPDGSTFSNAETVIYAKASYKPRVPDLKSLEMLIKKDAAEFREHFPGVVISENTPLKTASRGVLKTYTFVPSKQGNWEEVAYGEEEDFYLVFTISSRTKKGFDNSIAAYREFVGKYK